MFGRFLHLERMYIMTFSLDIKEFAEKTNRNVNDVKQAAAIELFGMIIKATPVGNPSLWKSPPPPGYVGGRLRGNWQASLNSPIKSATNTIDSGGSGTISEMTGVVNQSVVDDTIYISNSVPYAYRVEYLGWSRQQRPEGMVRVSMTRYQEAIQKAIAKLPK